MLPQAPEDAGYYVYGNVGGVPGTGHLAQYAHPNMLSVIFWVEREWQAIDDRKFGIGNISVANGLKYDHHTHMKGIEMNIRPVRKDKMVGQAARTPPTPKDRKVSLMFTGPLAQELFDYLGPDAKDSCSPDPDYQERNRGDLTCTWTRDQGYSCYFGLDARTGKSMHGSTC
jgi:hypothetical protein